MVRTALAAFAVATFIAFSAPVAADPATPADRAAFEQIILDQMDAFRTGDDARAFSHASAELQGIFGSPERFITMVRNGYQPVYRPSSVSFGDIVDTSDGPAQTVHVIGPHGNAWIALYTMERQADGTWRIAGCTLVRSADAGA